MTNAPSKVSNGQKAEIDSLSQRVRSLASKNKVVFAFFGVFLILISVGIITN